MGLFGPNPKNTRSESVSGAENIAMISAKLMQSGYTTLAPYSILNQHELLIEDADGQFWRVQCRTAWLSKDRVYLVFDGSSPWNKKVGGRRSSQKTQRNAVDYFAVYSPRLHKAYLIPASDVGENENYLRLVPAHDGISALWAQDYEL